LLEYHQLKLVADKKYLAVTSRWLLLICAILAVLWAIGMLVMWLAGGLSE
jgi:hypothetical protein